MKIPNVIKIMILNDSQKVSNLICFVKLLTYNKNPFSIGIFKTNSKGEFIITKEKIEEEMFKSIELFTMDYDGSLKNVKDEIEVVIESLEDINRRIERVKEFFPEKIEDFIFTLEANSNKIITSTVSNVYKIKKNIIIDIGNG